MPQKLKLKMAIAKFPHTAAVRDGSIPIEGVDIELVDVQPQIGAFRRMVRNLEFDICELAPTTYIIARAYDLPIKALPVFVTRRFHHSGILVRPEANIRGPKDLEGNKVGVRAYSVTTGVWTRSVLIDEFDVDNDKVTWVVDDEEHVQALKLPSNVVHVEEGKSLADMMASGELVGGFEGAAGIGRSGSPTGGWKEVEANYPDLFPNATELESEWYKRTKIYPMHGTIVVKEEILKEHPWVAKSIYDAFDTAKKQWLAKLEAGEATAASDKKYAALRDIVGPDPLPYGLEVNLPTIEALSKTAADQRLTPRRLAVDELFIDING